MEFKHVSLIALGIMMGAGASILAPEYFARPIQDQQLTVKDFPDLVGGLKATPGCIEVKTTAFGDGKQIAIFAWFENKAAVQAWYASSMHRSAMKKFFPNLPGRPTSLQGFKDEKSPLLVVATVTPSDKPMIEGSPLAVSQIAIEIYTPVPGGVTFGGGFGPKSLEVPGIVRRD